MRITVPITGELIGEGSGNPNNPIRPINLAKLLPVEVLDFSWTNAVYDYEKGLVSIEISFKNKQIPVEWDAQGKVTKLRRETDEELVGRKNASEVAIKALLEKSVGKLYDLSGEARLIKPVGS